MQPWPSLADPSIVDDPYPFYARLHAESPARWDPTALGLGMWEVASHSMCAALARDPRLSADRTIAWKMFLPKDAAGDLTGAALSGSLALIDPPDHTRLRGLIAKVFTPRAVEQLRTGIENVVGELLGKIDGDGELDLMSTLAKPLPVRVISELLGVPAADASILGPWIDDYAMFFGAIKGLKRAVASVANLHAYFDALLAERRAHPRGDLLTELIAAEEAGDRLTHAELIHTVLFLYLAGHHTTTNLIGNGMLALLRAPEQLDRIRREPGLVGNAVEELLRFDAPVQYIARLAKEEISLGEHTARPGQIVTLLLAAANRDPQVFEQPDVLDVGRSNANRHVSFGGGPHYCIGAPLARLEGKVAIEALLRRFGAIELAAEPKWIPNLGLRGLEALKVRVRA